MPFNEQERIDFVYPFTGNDPDMDLMLFFTDNVNEPKAINIRRCIHEDDEFTGNAPGYIGQELEVTHMKDYAMVELWDDRAVSVEKNTGRAVTLNELY